MLRGLIKVLGVLVTGMLLAGGAAWVTLKILTVRHEVTVPDFRGMTLEETMKTAEAKQLRVRVREPGLYSDVIPARRVARQDPLPGERVKPGRTIEITLSLGNEQVRMPDLKGDGYRSARLKLTKLGLEVRTALFIQHSGMPAGVIYQEPPPEVSVLRGRPVRLVINQVPEGTCVMPDLVGRPVDRVIAFFRRAGYRIGQVMYDTYGGVPPGIVLRHTPPAGAPLSKHDIINLVVSRLP